MSHHKVIKKNSLISHQNGIFKCTLCADGSVMWSYPKLMSCMYHIFTKVRLISSYTYNEINRKGECMLPFHLRHVSYNKIVRKFLVWKLIPIWCFILSNVVVHSVFLKQTCPITKWSKKFTHITPKRYFQVHSLRGRISNVVLPQIDVLHVTNLHEG